MLLIIKKRFLYFAILILVISCQNHHNTKKLNLIQNLEQLILNDKNNLNIVEIKNIENTLKISRFNLSKLERKKLDSISVRLMYFDYREYLDCVNTMYKSVNVIHNLKNELAVNSKQLKNMKNDYKNSKKKRDDLDKYLLEESNYIKQTSEKISATINMLIQQREKFDSLNKKIEAIID